MAYHLEPNESLAYGLRRVAAERAAAAVDHLTPPTPPPNAVHEARKRGKEARAALRLLRGALGAGPERAARARFAAAGRQVSPLRDSEVAVETLASLRRHQRLLRAEREAAEEVLVARHRAAEAAVTASLRHQVAAAFAAAATDLPTLSHATTDSVADSLARIHRRGRRRMLAALESGDAEAYHAWRKVTKDLWYAVRLFEPVWPGPLGALSQELHDLSRLLGDEHDLTVLRHTLVEAGGESPLLTPRLERAIVRRQRRLRAEAHAAGDRLWAEGSRSFARRILTAWTGWRRQAT